MRSSSPPSPSRPDTLYKSTSLEDGPTTPYPEVDFKASRTDLSRHEPTSFPARAWRKVVSTDFVEGHGVAPLAESQRTDAKFIQNFTLWLTMNATIACFSTGTLGPVLYGLSLRDSSLIIALVNIFSCGIPSYVACFGPKLGARTMLVARYSYGYYGSMLPALLNLVSFIGFCAVNSIVAGQVLVAVNPGELSTTTGIVIVAVISMVISFFGYRVLHACERWAWIPICISFVLLAGFGGRHLGAATSFNVGASTKGGILSFISIIVGFTLSWSGCSADFNSYMRPDVSKTKVFILTFAGLYLPACLLQIQGAAFAAAALSGLVPTWEEAYNAGSVGGLVGVALEPLHGFGKFLLVLFALGMISNNAPTTYAFSLSIQIVFPFLTRVPRFFFAIVCTAIYLPIAVVGASEFEAALSNFLGLIGGWSSIFVAVLLAEHFIFRRFSFTSGYDLSIWDRSSKLPPGIAALFASFCGAALYIVGMDQVWFRGPIAKLITGPDEHYGGDVGFETGMAVAAIVYIPSRWLEKRLLGR
ncbi:uncharacterized protein JCM6883_004031 [Sporobolomyces salmoneus]|uniref:uncharacterized protein n=1 Tax=Sporobolomyces salmoneus TaxID=183962 RepID=UPI00316D3620